MKDLLFLSIVLFYGICCVKVESGHLAASTTDDYWEVDGLAHSNASAPNEAFRGIGTLSPEGENVTHSTADWYQDDDRAEDSKANVSKTAFSRNGTVKSTSWKTFKSIYDQYMNNLTKQQEGFERNYVFKIPTFDISPRMKINSQNDDQQKNTMRVFYSTFGKIAVALMIGGGASACYRRRCKKKSPTSDNQDAIPIYPPTSKV